MTVYILIYQYHIKLIEPYYCVYHLKGNMSSSPTITSQPLGREAVAYDRQYYLKSHK